MCWIAFSEPSIIPAWVQAGAAVGSLFVTWWLARITKGYAETTRAISVDTSRQVAHALALAKRQELGVVAALLEETRRISSELGDTPEDGLIGLARSSVVIPEVHPWVHPVIPQVALADAEVVGLFLKVDRYLSNHASLMAELARDEAALSGARASLARLEEREVPPGNDLGSLLADILESEFETRRQVHTAELNLDQTNRRARITYGHCRNALAELDRRLSGILAVGAEGTAAIATRENRDA